MSKIYTVNFPDIGEGVVEGEIIEWLKNVGDQVKQDEPVVIVMTDKATVELPSPYPGKLVQQHYKVGEMAIKDKPLYAIEGESTELPKKEVLATPYVRNLAKEMGINIDQIRGSGKDGRVEEKDLKKNTDDEEVPVTGIRHFMAKKMAEAKDKIPHFSYFEQVDATKLVHLRQKYKEKGATQGVHVTFMPFIIRALSLVILKYPEVNSSYDDVRNKLVIWKKSLLGFW